MPKIDGRSLAQPTGPSLYICAAHPYVMEGSFLIFFHSLLRWLVLLALVIAAGTAWRGWLAQRPIIVWERSVTILAMVLCHVQLLLGLVLYMINFKSYTIVGMRGGSTGLTNDVVRYWKYEHIGMMILAIALVTIGRVLSKRAKEEPAKQRHIALFYTAGLLLILYMIPWPFTFLGAGRGWL